MVISALLVIAWRLPAAVPAAGEGRKKECRWCHYPAGKIRLPPGPKALGDRSAYLLSGMPLLQLLKMMKGAQGQVCSPVKGKKRRVITLPRTFHPMPAITIQPHHPAGSVTRLLTRQVSRVTPSHAPYSPVSYLWKSGPLNFTRGISRAENPTEKRYLKWFSFL